MMNSSFLHTRMKRKGDAPFEDSSDKKKSKWTKLEDFNDTDNSKEQEPVPYTIKIRNGQILSGNEQSANERVEIPVEYNLDYNRRLQSAFKVLDKIEKKDRNGSETENDKSKHVVTKDSTVSKVSDKTTVKICSRYELSDISVNEATVTENVLISERKDETEDNHCNTERQQETKEEENEYVYRILRFNESYRQGLRPKDINSRISLERHVGEGSKGVKSRYISCCKTMSALRCLGEITNESNRVRIVVRINISKLDRDNVKVIDLTDLNIRRQHINSASQAWEFAERFDEVILAPTSHVPEECVERVGKIHKRSFKKDAHIDLD